ncbi:MAG: DUF6917 domain-containing protein [Clostridia bacterium]
MRNDPYVRGVFGAGGNPFLEKSVVVGRLVARLGGFSEDRNLSLIPQASRVLNQGEIHELICTTERAGPGDRVASVGYFGFFEVEIGGVALSGDTVKVGGFSGELVGFDETHAPNHCNLVVRCSQPVDGTKIVLDSEVEIGGMTV